MRSLGGTLWVADIDEVVAINIETAGGSAHVKVDGALFLNDLATAPDGTVYASDSNLSRIYAVKDGKSSVFVEGADRWRSRMDCSLMDAPGSRNNRCRRARGRGRPRRGPPPSGHLYAFDLTTKQRTRLTTTGWGDRRNRLDGAGACSSRT